MAKLRQSEHASEFATIIFPKDTHAKLMNDQLDYISKVWKGIGKSVEKNKPIEEFNPGLTKEAKKYLKKYSKTVALQVVNLRNKIQANEIVPAKTEEENLTVERHDAQIEAFLNYLNYFKYTEDESTKAFCSLIKDTRQMIFGDRI